MRRLNRRGALLAFTASGAAGLIFEVAAQRMLARIFGVGAYASATVLASYMGGLALGAWLLGRRADVTKSPLRLYAGLELGIALYAVAMPFLMEAGSQLFVSLFRGAEPGQGLVLGRLAFAAALLTIPTVLMGGTLPVFARALVASSKGRGSPVATVYTANLLGAALGAALAAYVLMPGLGLRGTLMVGAALNLTAAVAALLLARSWSAFAQDTEGAPATVARPTLLAWSFWSGLFTFALEVTWVHLLAIVVGNSAYAFGVMLSIFLFGLTLGSGWAARRAEASLTQISRLQFAAAIALAVTFPLWDRVPVLFVLVGDLITSFAGRELFRAAICLYLLLLPAVILGAVYPLLLKLASQAQRAGAAVGGLAAANTLGAVAGSLLTGFVVLPALRSEGMLRLLATLAVAGALLAARSKRLALAAPVVLAAIWLTPSWNLARLAAGSNVYFDDRGYGDGEVLWARESVEGGLTSVVKQPRGVVMLTNGKFQGNDYGEMDAQLACQQIPLLVSHGHEAALVIGLGTGVTLAGVAAQPFKRVEAVELSRDVVDAARERFGHVNDRVLEGSRVKVHLGDGRNHLLLTTASYDVIAIELSSIWFAGAADLYNREFYQLVHDRLARGGVLQQWVQLHHLERKTLAVILESIRAVFPYVALFERGGQGVILASASPLEVDYARAAALTQQLQGKLTTVGLPGGEILALLADQLLEAEGIAKLVAEEGAVVSTDDNLWLEYQSPRGNALKGYTALSMMKSLQGLPRTPMKVVGADAQAQKAHVRAAYLAGTGEVEPALEAARTALAGGIPVERLIAQLEEQRAKEAQAAP